MKIIKLAVFATIITIMIATFTIPVVMSIVEEGGGGSSGPSGPTYLTYTNTGQTMAEITPETTPTIEISVISGGVSINGETVEVGDPAVVAMAPGSFTAAAPGLVIGLKNGMLSVSASKQVGGQTMINGLTEIQLTAQSGHWTYQTTTLANTTIYTVSDTGEYVNVPLETPMYVPADKKVAAIYSYGSNWAMTNFVPSDYVGYYKGTVADVPGAVELTLANNDMGALVCALAPKTLVTDIETEAPTPPADDNPVWNMVGIIPLVLLVGMVMIVVTEGFRKGEI